MRTTIGISVLALILLASFGVDTMTAQEGRGRGRGRGRGFQLPPLLMTSDAFQDGGVIPDRFTCTAGQGSPNPAFSWTGAPDTTRSYAIIFHDIDVAIGGNTGDVLHWVLWNIPANAGGIPEGMAAGTLPDGTVQGTGLTGQNAYFGPCAPAGERYHHYVFELYALSEMLDLPETAGRDELLEAMAGKTTAKAAYVGRFRR